MGKPLGNNDVLTALTPIWTAEHRVPLSKAALAILEQAQARVQGLEEQMRQALASWSLRPAVEALISLRGVKLITAMTVPAELGDLTRFDSPRRPRRSTLVTSQLPVEHWHKMIGEPTHADAILDRLVHNAYRIELKGESMRKLNAKGGKRLKAKS